MANVRGEAPSRCSECGTHDACDGALRRSFTVTFCRKVYKSLCTCTTLTHRSLTLSLSLYLLFA